jgi:hypothetical protein
MGRAPALTRRRHASRRGDASHERREVRDARTVLRRAGLADRDRTGRSGSPCPIKAHPGGREAMPRRNPGKRAKDAPPPRRQRWAVRLSRRPNDAMRKLLVAVGLVVLICTAPRSSVGSDRRRAALVALLATFGPSRLRRPARRARQRIGSILSVESTRIQWRSSSVVEQGTHKPLVGGSNPPSATNPPWTAGRDGSVC